MWPPRDQALLCVCLPGATPSACLPLICPAPALPCPDLPAAEEATARIGQLQAARRLLNIHKALTALHADEDFQADASQVGWVVGGWVGGWVDGWVGGWVGGRLAGWLTGWMDGWLVGWLAGWVGGWVGRPCPLSQGMPPLVEGDLSVCQLATQQADSPTFAPPYLAKPHLKQYLPAPTPAAACAGGD